MIYIFIAPRRSQKNAINFVTFITRVELTSWCLLRPWYIKDNRNTKKITNENKKKTREIYRKTRIKQDGALVGLYEYQRETRGRQDKFWVKIFGTFDEHKMCTRGTQKE